MVLVEIFYAETESLFGSISLCENLNITRRNFTRRAAPHEISAAKSMPCSWLVLKQASTELYSAFQISTRAKGLRLLATRSTSQTKDRENVLVEFLTVQRLLAVHELHRLDTAH